MNINKGMVVYEIESDLEYKRLVEDFVEDAKLTRTALKQFINSVIALRDLKEKININRESNLFYFISIRKLLDTIELKNTLKDVSEQRESISKSGDYLDRKVEEYVNILEQDEDSKRVEIVKNMFIGYIKMYLERVDKQVTASSKYLIRVKKIEKAAAEDKEFFADVEGDILKNDAKLNIIITELKDIWLKVSESVIENIVDDIKVVIDELGEERDGVDGQKSIDNSSESKKEESDKKEEDK